ncbi:MAG TPA: glucoamylase family protein [Chitinophagaceae bacterium]|nr:glucoamylase family protein [Chitinophagaceae bacterium]
MMRVRIFIVVLIMVSCSKKDDTTVSPGADSFSYQLITINGLPIQPFKGISVQPTISVKFSAPLNRNSVAGKINLSTISGPDIAVNLNFASNDSMVLLSPQSRLDYLTHYKIKLDASLTSTSGATFNNPSEISFYTSLDSSRKFPAISDSALLDLVQQQTLKYFYDFGHPVSGLSRERNTSGDLVTSGGSGFGIMAMIVGAHRNFITRAQFLSQMQTIVAFLKNTAQTFKGAYPHWLNGSTGVVIPFSANDNGADLVETSYLIQGLLCARQYFNGTDAAETALRADINFIYNRVEWNWFKQPSENVLTWHWSPSLGFIINLKIRGWNECLITYLLARSSSTYPISNSVYQQGWTSNGSTGFINGNIYYGYQLPLGPGFGGPLFFEHYSFMGINPAELKDSYADYAKQTKNHTLINYNYCKSNPQNYYGYSDSVWGLTASDIPGGYSASSPTNDLGVIAPTAALSSFPYTPTESMKALKFYYYVLGDKLFKQYGFVDAFKLEEPWFADSYLAIDQGPIIVMIENYRSGLLWNLFTSCPEIKTAMLALGFNAPYL